MDCPNCGFKNLVGERYCSECGTYLLSSIKKSFSASENSEKPKKKEDPSIAVTAKLEDEPEKETDENEGRYYGSSELLKPGALLQKRYKVKKLIGQGGMGAIYLADDTRFSNRECVLKEMLDNFSDKDQRETAVNNFLREADILANLHHDGIPDVYDRFSEGNRHYLVMEFVNGVDLEQKLEQQDDPFDERSVVNWSIQICDILSYLHDQKPPVIYRDMKPANLILTKQGKIYMVDFGIARFFNPVKKGTMVGTQGYAPPEQYRGLIEPRSDIYALGATIHHLLTQRDPQEEPPFSFPEIRKVNSKLSSSTEKIISKSLEKDVSDRFETAEEMLKALLKVSINQTDSLKVCPYCNNKVNATKQFCPECNEYIASIAFDESNNRRSLKDLFLSTKFLLIIIILSLLINIVCFILLLTK